MEYTSDGKRQNTIGCLDQYTSRGLRLWNGRDRKTVLVYMYLRRMETMDSQAHEAVDVLVAPLWLCGGYVDCLYQWHISKASCFHWLSHPHTSADLSIAWNSGVLGTRFYLEILIHMADQTLGLAQPYWLEWFIFSYDGYEHSSCYNVIFHPNSCRLQKLHSNWFQQCSCEPPLNNNHSI